MVPMFFPLSIVAALVSRGLVPSDSRVASRNERLSIQTPTSYFPTQLDMSVPASAALDVLGVSASKAKSASSLEDLSLGIINSFDGSGHLKNGFGFNMPVYQLRPISANRIFQDEGQRRLSMSNVAIAAVRGTGEDKSARVAASFSIPFIDRTDWRYDPVTRKQWEDQATKWLTEVDIPDIARAQEGAIYVKEWLAALGKAELGNKDKHFDDVTKAKGALSAFGGSVPEGKTVQELRDSHNDSWAKIEASMKPVLDSRSEIENNLYDRFMEKEWKKVTDSYEDSHWNDTKFDVSVAYAAFAADADQNGLKGEGSYIAASLATKLGRGQLTLVGRWASKDRSWDKDAKTWKLGDSGEYGVRYRGGSKDSGIFIEFLESSKKPDGGSRALSRIIQGGYERKLRDGQWLQISLGGGSGALSKTVFGLNLAFNLGNTRLMDEQGKVKGK